MGLLAAYNAVSVRARTSIARMMERAGFYPEALVYGGYASEEKARVMGRVVMSRSRDQRQWLHERRGWRQFFDAQVPLQPVLIRFGQATLLTRTSEDGYFDVELTGHGLPQGRHDLSVQVLHHEDVVDGLHLDDEGTLVAPHEGSIRATSPFTVGVRVVSSSETVGLVSDIDDTIMVSMIPRPVLAAKYAFVDYVSERQAVPGMASFLQSLSRGYGSEQLPQIYLSTGAWNLVPALRRFVERVGYPLGTFLMTDFGPSHSGWFRSGREHKRRELRRLAAFFPQMKWILVGDDGQNDPMVYGEFAVEFPNNVEAIAIRTLSSVEQLVSHGPKRKIMPEALQTIPEGIPVLVGANGDELLEQWQRVCG